MKLELKKVIGNVILLAVILIIAARAVSIATDTEQPTPVSVITSGSMEPTMYRGDIVFWVPTPIENIREGDIVVFRSSVHGASVAHRVMEVSEGGTGIELMTQGDANEYLDQLGPHYPERPVRESNLYGRVISINNQPLRIPFAGHLWLTTEGFFGEILGGTFGGAGGVLVLVPLLTAGIMLIGMVLMLPDEDKDEERKLIEQIIGIEHKKTSALLVFAVLILAFMLVVMPSTWYAYESYDVSIGIGERADSARESFNFVRPGQVINGTHRLNNPGFVHTNIYTFSEGDGSHWIEVCDDYVGVRADSRLEGNFTIVVPEQAAPGVYTFSVFHYHSPFWGLYPDEFVLNTIGDEPRMGIMTLNLITAILFASITMGVMLLFSFLIDEFKLWKEYFKVRKVMSDTERMELTLSTRIYLAVSGAWVWLNRRLDWLRSLDVVDFDAEAPMTAASVGLVSIPLVWLGADLWILPLVVIIATAFAYYLDCRWRAEMFTAALVSGGIAVSSFYLIPLLVSASEGPELLGLLLISSGIALMIFLLLTPFILLLSYLSALVLHWYKLRVSSVARLEITDL